MKAVYHKKSQSVSYVCNDSTTIEIVNNNLVCSGDDVGTNIYPTIVGANDFTIIENVTPPEGYRNSKYTINQIDGEWVWSLNLKWEDPTPPIPEDNTEPDNPVVTLSDEYKKEIDFIIAGTPYKWDEDLNTWVAA